MIRFIGNFILFGILFYLIWRFFPDAFETLVSWAAAIYEFFKNLFATTMERMNHQGGNKF